MKFKLILTAVLFVAFPFFGRSQSNIPAKTFTVKELLMLLDSLPGEKITDYMLEHGFMFENKGNVYAPSYKGPVKDAYTLRYLKNKKHFIISFYSNRKYLVNYFLESDQDLDSLITGFSPAGFNLTGHKDSMKFYDSSNSRYSITITRLPTFKVFSLADMTVVEKYKLMPF